MSTPLSGPKTSSICFSSCSATSRARSVNAASTSRETLLELAAHEVGVRAGLLAVEHARADLDRVDDRLDGVLPRLLALLHEAQRAVVLDDQAVDDQAVADRADVR